MRPLHPFAERLINWQREYGRHDLPWQRADAYRVWLSEVMLQQTQVATVIPYYQRFIASFPDVAALAGAGEEGVLAHWSGLGYYARGRNLYKAARIIVERFKGQFPRRFEEIAELPGIGRSTAAAICALAWHERRAILDGNVKRVLARYCGISGSPNERAVEDQLWQRAEALLPHSHIADYIQAQMDLGAMLCTRSKPKCQVCPVRSDCVALQTGRVQELPTPRLRKALPEKQAVMLLLMHGGDILLEKRAATGIWGGMWSLPQFHDEVAAKDWFLRQNMAASAGWQLETFTHTFTHFKLHITPLKIGLARKPVPVVPSGMVWLHIDEALRAAIPAPVKKILAVDAVP